jgi:hypothetical protein
MGNAYKIFLPLSCGASVYGGLDLVFQYKATGMGIWIFIMALLAFITYLFRPPDIKRGN